MKFTLDDLRKTKAGQIPSNQRLIAEAIKKHGPGADVHTLGAMGNSEPQRNQAGSPLVRKLQTHQTGEASLGLCITIVRFGYKELDDDNLVAGAKPLRDSIATSLGLDDADKRIVWCYRQVVGGGRNGTLVKIDAIVL